MCFYFISFQYSKNTLKGLLKRAQVNVYQCLKPVNIFTAKTVRSSWLELKSSWFVGADHVVCVEQ